MTTEAVAGKPPRFALAGLVGTRMARVASFAVLAALAISTIYPLLFLASTSLRTEDDYVHDPGGIPQKFTLDYIREAFTSLRIGHLVINSLLVVVPAVILIVAVSALAAYALTLFDFPFRRTTLVVVVATMALPQTVILIPIFKTVLDAGLLNERLGLVLVYAGLNLPFSIYLLASYMRGIPKELLSSAQIDGAGPLRALWSIVLPLVRPGLLTLVTLNFLVLWNELLFSLVILQTESSRTIMVGIAEYQGQFSRNFGVISAGLLVSTIPPLLIFVLFQRNLTRGLTTGSVK